MVVKELITKLLDAPMGAHVVLKIDEEFIDEEYGVKCKGYLFDIDDFEYDGLANIYFTDWRKKGAFEPVKGVSDD